MFEVLTRLLRSHLVGRRERFEFRAADGPAASLSADDPDFYLHVPLCRNFCPYCPYYKERYDPDLADLIAAGVDREIELWSGHPGMNSTAGGTASLYVGGGTPALLGDRLPALLDRIRSRFPGIGTTAIELDPAGVTEEQVAMLRRAGVTMVSLGVQSFDAAHLRRIGRPYGPQEADRAIALVVDGGFELVNLDMMCALPGQSVEALRDDMATALDSGADQLTFYPLFTFPYTSVGRAKRERNVKLPPLAVRRTHYRQLHRTMEQAGLTPVSVWGFTRDDRLKYSSVTRDHFVGLGPGAATHLPGQFLFNTFSIDHYSERIAAGRHATALAMTMSDKLERYYWLYWRLYGRRIPLAEFQDRFADDPRAARWLRFAGRLGMLSETDGRLELSERGAFWIHWVQNQFILRYIDKVWQRAMAEPFPRRIVI